MDEIEILEEPSETGQLVPADVLPVDIWMILLDYCFVWLFGTCKFFRDIILHPETRYKLFVTDGCFPRKKLKRPYDYIPGLKHPTTINTSTKEYRLRLDALANIAHKVERVVVCAPATMKAILSMADKFEYLKVIINKTQQRIDVETCGFPTTPKLLFKPPKTWQQRKAKEWQRFFEKL